MKNFAAGTMLLVLVLAISLCSSCNKTTTESGSGTAQTTAAGGTEASSGQQQQQMAANPATDFKFRTPGGSTESLSKYLGKPLVVNFWADW